jgi:hypothetical protein
MSHHLSPPQYTRGWLLDQRGSLGPSQIRLSSQFQVVDTMRLFQLRQFSAQPAPQRRWRTYTTGSADRPKSPHAQWYADIVPAMIPIALLGSAVYLVRFMVLIRFICLCRSRVLGSAVRTVNIVARKIYGRGQGACEGVGNRD